MARYIDADALIKVLDAKADMAMGTPKEVFLSVSKMVDYLPPAAVEPRAEWISVEERLPKPFVSVLVYMPEETPHPTVREGFVNKRGEWCAGGFDRLPGEVVAWMDMPEPPKGDAS
jgi:hypothetical protein